MVGLERTVPDFHTVAGRFAADTLRHPLRACFVLYVPWASSFSHGGHQCVGRHYHSQYNKTLCLDLSVGEELSRSMDLMIDCGEQSSGKGGE